MPMRVCADSERHDTIGPSVQPQPHPSLLPVFPPPIHRLPSELLVVIFASCWSSFTPAFQDTNGAATFEVEISRLAHAPLLELSRVCGRWHTIAIGTPSLWNEIQLDGVLWSSPIPKQANALRLLQLALERGGNSPLTLMIRNDYDAVAYGPALDLLAAHSERWQAAAFGCPLDIFTGLAAAKGKLSRLEYLEIHLWDGEDNSTDLSSIFEVAPRLQDLTFGDCSPLAMSNFPLAQLSWLACLSLFPHDIPTVVSWTPRLGHAAELRLQFSLILQLPSDTLDLDIAPVTSDLASLYIEVMDPFHPPHSSQALGSIFRALTLPCLNKLELESKEYPHFPLTWSHAPFISMCTRSSFDAHLQSLDIYDVHISHADLLECLSCLPSLERLAISDHQLVADDGVAEVLITNALLAQLTLSPDSPDLIPRLRSISCQSLLQFDDSAFLAFVLSRVCTEHSNPRPFESHLCWLPGRHRAIDHGVVARFDELSAKKSLVFRFSEAESEWI
ncbi:hypothetical protein FB451DRAFT_1243897 [Mycena latifolia]|nr:hypothetical protein FB451DRAFT_1243897 [Mycena latifolia]